MKWYDIYGWPYRINRAGQIKRLDSGKILTPMMTGQHGNKYPTVTLCNKGVFRTYKVHRLMAETFLDPIPDKPLVLHRDGDRANNHIKNLYYGSQRENMRDARRHHQHKHKLTLAQVEEVRRRRAAGEAGRSLAAEYGVSEQYICDIHRGRK